MFEKDSINTKKNNYEQLVRKCYLEILRREPDESGFNHYVSQLNNGDVSPAQLPEIFKNSIEYSHEPKNFLQHNLQKNFSKIPILMYHEISDQNNPWCVSPDEFCKQMQLLKDKNYKTISLTKLKKIIDNHDNVIDKLIAITFDDGCSGVYKNAYSILKNNNFTATIYVVPAWIENNQILFEGQFSTYMSWKNLKELSVHGFDIGSHTFSHKWLVKLENNELKKELDLGDKSIKDNLDLDVKHFCYPYGSFTEQIQKIIIERYDTAVSTIKDFSKITGAYSRQWVMRDTSLDEFSKLLIYP
jgi:peptidoglycan/xylan/chitin deacetylase (PgdA/CDA1 family)